MLKQDDRISIHSFIHSTAQEYSQFQKPLLILHKELRHVFDEDTDSFLISLIKLTHDSVIKHHADYCWELIHIINRIKTDLLNLSHKLGRPKRLELQHEKFSYDQDVQNCELLIQVLKKMADFIKKHAAITITDPFLR